MRYFLGLDVGTSSVKAILVDGRGRVKAGASVNLALATPRPGWAEQHPDQWWKASASAIRQALRNARAKPGDVASVGMSGQMHSSVFLDAEGAVIRPALLW